MVNRRGKTDDISCRLSSAKCGERKDTHAIGSNAGAAADARIKIESESTLAQAAGARERAVLCAVKGNWEGRTEEA